MEVTCALSLPAAAIESRSPHTTDSSHRGAKEDKTMVDSEIRVAEAGVRSVVELPLEARIHAASGTQMDRSIKRSRLSTGWPTRGPRTPARLPLRGVVRWAW